ncbi:MAG: hypothetical protein IPP43_11180 [Chitinophagaceae bacterium]|nr:hypothetical protein [Chitinophagaceae bacterium]
MAGFSQSSANGDVTDVNHGGPNGTYDSWIVKLDAERNITWNKLLGANGDEEATCIQQTTDGGYIVAGYSNSSANGDVTEINNGNDDYWVVKLDASRNIIWNRLIGGSGTDKAQSIRQTIDGSYIVAGFSNSSASGNVSGVNHGGYDYWIVKLDGNGNMIWDRLLGGNGDEMAKQIIQGNDETIVVAGPIYFFS